MENVSLNMDSELNEDEDDIEERQKEIQGLLSTAFDDLSSLSEDEDEYNQFKNFGANRQNKYETTNGNVANKWTNNGLTSTPRLVDRSANDDKSYWLNTNGQSEYRFNISDVLEEDEDKDKDNEVNVNVNVKECLNNNDFGLNFKNSKINGQLPDNSVEHQRPESPDSRQVATERSYSQRHVQLLIEENQRLSNELIVCQQKLSTITGNYDGLQYKLRELDEINSEKENQLVRLEGKIKSLEMTVKVEKEAKEEMQRKASVCESTIESLQYQLREIEKSDCLVRTQQTHQSVIDSLKAKHQNEVLLLNGEIEGLKHELSVKNSEIKAIKEESERKRVTDNENDFKEQLKHMIEVTKDLWEKQMKEKMENDFKSLIDYHEKKWSKSREQEMIEQRNKWDNDLEKEVSQLIELLKLKAKVSVGSLPENVSLRFVPLLNLWRAIQDSYDCKEEALRVQIDKLKDAKLQLEEALNESRHSQSSPSRSPDGPSNDRLFDQLRTELQKVSEEAVLMKQKLYKYKQHYHRLVKRHESEIQDIKEEFAQILQTFKPQLT